MEGERWLARVDYRVGVVARSVPAQADLIVANTKNNNVLHYDTTTGDYLGVFTSGGGTTLPGDVAFGPDGRLYVLSSGNAIYRYDGLTGVFVDQLVDSSTSPINGAQAITFDSAGTLYVANTNSNNILRYDTTTGDFLGIFAVGRTALPVDIAFGPDGMLYMLSDGVYRYDGLTGAYVDQMVDSSTSPSTEPRLSFDLWEVLCLSRRQITTFPSTVNRDYLASRNWKNGFPVDIASAPDGICTCSRWLLSLRWVTGFCRQFADSSTSPLNGPRFKRQSRPHPRTCALAIGGAERVG